MGIPQIIYIALLFLGLGIDIAQHGKPTKHDGVVSAISVGITLILLSWGGFFS